MKLEVEKDEQDSDIVSKNFIADPLDGTSIFGTFQYNGSGWQTINFPFSFMFPPIVVVTPVNAEGYFSINNITTSSFQYRMTKVTVTVTPTKESYFVADSSYSSATHTSKPIVIDVTASTSTSNASSHTVNYIAFDPKGR